MKHALTHLAPAATFSQDDLTAAAIPSGLSDAWFLAARRSATAFWAWVMDPHPAGPVVQMVRVERKKTVFYPIGWMAIAGVGAWFAWLTVG
jgi:hypothetical protein